MKYKVKCLQCGIEFLVYARRFNGGKGNYFCSTKCSGEYRRASCDTKVVANCSLCNKEFKLKKSQYKKRNKNGMISCSAKCMGELKKKRYEGRKNPNCKYKTFPDNFFKEIDTEQKAYILGFIASDGSLHKNGATSIGIKDKEILKKMRDIVCKDIPISISKKETADLYYIRFCSKIMMRDICKWLEIKPGKKDDKVKMPRIDSKLQWHFLRGFFDGDGTIRKKSKGRTIDCAIYTYSDYLRRGIEKLCDVKCNNNNKWKYVSWSGKNARKFLDRLYLDATIYMDRKHKTYLSWS